MKDYSFGEFLDVKQQQLIESGASRVRRMMWGNVPVVNSVGIMTANNPKGEMPHPMGTRAENKKENNRLNAQLMDDLRAAGFGPIKCKGKFDTNDPQLPAAEEWKAWEDSYVIPNMKRDTLCALGAKYNQRAVIWGARATDENGHPFFRFQYIDGQPWAGQPYKTINTREVHVGNEDIQGRDNFYTQLKGRKVIIPFFTDKYAKYKPGKQYGTIQQPQQAVPAIPPAADLAKAEGFVLFRPGKESLYLQAIAEAESFFIPMFDDPLAEVELFNGHEPSYYAESLRNDPKAMEIVGEIHRCERDLAAEGKIGKWYWAARGYMEDRLEALAEYLK